jgi:drug/metabolite transporter (DMT)-like permease
MALVATVLASIASGGVSTASKIVIKDIPPFSYVFLRFGLASVLLLPFLRSFRLGPLREVRPLLGVSALGIANALFFVLGIQFTTASTGQMLYAGVPILAALASAVWLRHRISARKFGWMSLGLAGAVLVILLPVIDRHPASVGSLKGNLLIFVGVVSWALYLTLSKPLHDRFNSLAMTAAFVMLCAVLFAPLAALEAFLHWGWWRHLDASAVVGIFYLTVFGTVGNYLLIQYAVRHGGPMVASLSLYLIPVFAFASAFLLLGERPSAGLLVGTGLVFASVAAITYSK